MYISEQKKVNEQFGRKMNEDMNGNKKLFWKEVSNVKGGKVGSCNRIKDRNGRLAQRKDEVRRNGKGYFEDLYNIDTEEHSTCVALIGFREVTTSNGRATGEDEITGEMIKGGGDKVVDRIWRLCNMVFESGVVPEDFSSAVIVPLYKSKGERNECKNYRGISLFSVVGEIYAGILINRVRRVTGDLLDDE